jgi:hypothetical protein
MQKVVGSSPIIRSERSPARRGFLLHDEDQTTTLIAGGQEVRAQFNGFSEVEEALTIVQDFFEMSLETLGVKEVKFMGSRTYWGAASSSFDELLAWMVERLGSEVTAALAAQVGSKVTDAGWAFEFMDKDPKHRLTFGPMTRDQFLERVLPNASADDIPETFLFMDLDRIYTESTHTRDQALTKWRENFERNLDVGRAAGGILTGELAIS